MRAERIKFIFPHLSEEIEIRGEKYRTEKVDRHNLCKGCAFHHRGEPCKAGGTVLCIWDNQNYIFKKL